jgi:acetolactate synthase-1/2/3 large subunit
MIELVNKYFNDDAIIVADVGQNQMWTAQFYKFKKPNTFLTSGGLGTMGYALPAAIGAKFAAPDKEVVVIVGDGGFQMNIQELMTVNQYNLKIKILVLDNSALGMVRQWQQLFFGQRYSGTSLNHNPSFKGIANAIGIRAETLTDLNRCEDLIKEFAVADEPMLIHAMVSKNEIVLPMVPAGGSIDESISSIKGF